MLNMFCIQDESYMDRTLTGAEGGFQEADCEYYALLVSVLVSVIAQGLNGT